MAPDTIVINTQSAQFRTSTKNCIPNENWYRWPSQSSRLPSSPAPAPGTSLEKFHLKWNAKDYCQESHYSTKNHFLSAPCPFPLAPSAERTIHFQLNWNACFLTTTFATYYTIAHFPFRHELPSCRGVVSARPCHSRPFARIFRFCYVPQPSTLPHQDPTRRHCRNPGKSNTEQSHFLRNMDILGLWICWKIKMAATSQCERVRERDLFALQQSQGVSCTPMPLPYPPPFPLKW